MRVLVAGASGVIGRPLVPLLVERAHAVAGLTRSQGDLVRSLGAEPIVCEVYDAAQVRELAAANARIRREGTRNLFAAAPDARVVAQSVAFPLSPEGAAACAELERLVAGRGGVSLRLGRLHGPGTYYEDELPPEPRIHIDEAARLFADAVG
jgi:uncharacterized protein YbjT (DUF2867 family)